MSLEPTAGATVVDVTAENAQAVLIEESLARPVLVDFWAPWCEPCKTMMPMLESLAQEFGGRFLLARVNADEQAMVASQFGVQSLPTLVIMKDQQPVDGLVGAQSEQTVRELLAKYLPQQWQLDVQAAQQLIDAGDVDARVKAVSLLNAAWQDAKHESALLPLVNLLIEDNKIGEAEQLLNQVPLQDRQSSWQQLMAQCKLKQDAERAPEVVALEQAFAQSPQDCALGVQLAVALSQHKYHEQALALLFGLLQKDLNAMDGGVKKTFHNLLAALGKGDPIAVMYQRKLYTLLY